jgi:tRNA 2-thiouridine synthesizing protein A
VTQSSDDSQDQKTASTLADTERMTGAKCAGCTACVCGHAAVFSLVLGYKNAPRCLPCVAAHMSEEVASLRERTLTYVQHHDCYRAAWSRASQLEGFGDELRPACLWHAKVATSDVRDASGVKGEAAVLASSIEAAPASDAIAARWDAGGMGCGDLVLELRLRLRDLAPGELFELTATDAGAPIDLPAWCGLTGHQLLAAQHPIYRIRRKA